MPARFQRVVTTVWAPDMCAVPSPGAATSALRAQLATLLTEAIAATHELRLHVERTRFRVHDRPPPGSHHEQFDDLLANLSAATDLLAVRCATLGGPAQTGPRPSTLKVPDDDERDEGEPHA